MNKAIIMVDWKFLVLEYFRRLSLQRKLNKGKIFIGKNSRSMVQSSNTCLEYVH